MSLTFPSTDVDVGALTKGAGGLYYGTYAANGADTATLNFFGSTRGGVTIHGARTSHFVDSDQYLNSIHAFATAESFQVKAMFQQVNLANLYALYGTADLTLSGGSTTDTSSSLTLGEAKTPRFVQLAWKGIAPLAATNGVRVYQFWKAYVEAIGDTKHAKTEEDVVEVTWRILADITAKAAGKGPIGQILDS